MEHPGALGNIQKLLPMNPLQIYNLFLKKQIYGCKRLHKTHRTA